MMIRAIAQAMNRVTALVLIPTAVAILGSTTTKKMMQNTDSTNLYEGVIISYVVSRDDSYAVYSMSWWLRMEA
jgi:hypothetical protein